MFGKKRKHSLDEHETEAVIEERKKDGAPEAASEIKSRAWKNHWFWNISIWCGLILFIATFISAANYDMKIAEANLSDTLNYVKKQCATYSGLNLASETKSLLRIIACARQVGRNLEAEQEDLETYAKDLHLSGIILLNPDGTVEAQYEDSSESMDLSGVEEELKKEVLLDTAKYPEKTYTTRIECADGSYIDLAACGRTDRDGIIAAYYHTRLGYIETYSLSFQNLLSGYSIEKDGTIVIASGNKIIASNDAVLEGKIVDDISDLRDIKERAADGQMVHMRSDFTRYQRSFGMIDRGRDYYVYAFIPERAVFQTAPRKLILFLIGYGAAMLIIQMVRWRMEHIYREEQMEREHAYRESLEEAARKAESANVAKTEFLQRMSHDIRTPINGIRGMVEIGDHFSRDLEKQAECRKKIYDASGLLLELVNEVLDMGKLESGEIVLESRPFNILSVVEEIRSVLEKQAEERGIRIFCDELQVEHAHVIGSPLHVKRLLMNIMGNAVKYNKDKGTVRLSCKEIRTEGKTAWIEIVCADTGIGMSKEFQEHLFEPFTQENIGSRAKYGGTGLGMSIAKSLLDKMGGKIRFESEKDVGTTYYITIPFRIDEEDRQEETKKPAADPAVLKGKQMLLAEDNELNMEIAEFLLENAGVSVTKAYNGKEAVEQFEQSAPGTYDAVLLDVMMPVMDGCQAARTIRSLNRPDAKTVPILAMTANAFSEDSRKTREAGMNAHLTKPLETDKVLKTLAELCEADQV